jgi:prepilin-type N-terminal cleavage/methylation domain-containing protein/prepilin-type processing-associated H-X9-DG protein
MTAFRRRRAFTLIELLVVIAIITLLMSILLPSVSRAREQSRSAVCLSNMHQIGILLQQYANDDPGSHAMPIHILMIRATGHDWLPAGANPFTWGGRDGQQSIPVPTSSGPVDVWLTDDARGWRPPGLDTPVYGAQSRPLNRYYLGTGFTDRDRRDMPLFRCPSDTGAAHTVCNSLPPERKDTPCYDLFGNSFRANLYSFMSDQGALSLSPWGHARDAVPQPGRIVLFADAPLYDLFAPHPQLRDWHGRLGSGNAAFADGSARTTLAKLNPPVDEPTAVAMRLKVHACDINYELLRQGPSWRLDVWPLPAARLWTVPEPRCPPEDSYLWDDRFCAIPDPSPFCWNRALWPFDPHVHVAE